jgi:ribosome-associated translation inhibitor RaiA
MAQRESAQEFSEWLRAHVRVIGVSITDENRVFIKQTLARKLRKFASSVHRASVRVTDVNGPRGGQDQLCRVKVVLPGLVTVVVERRHAKLRAAVSAALLAAERSVQQRVGRQRLKPHRDRTRRRPGTAPRRS